MSEDSARRAELNAKLGFYPARTDDASVAEYLRADAEQRRWYAEYQAEYGPGGSKRHKWAHLRHEADERREQEALRAELRHLYDKDRPT